MNTSDEGVIVDRTLTIDRAFRVVRLWLDGWSYQQIGESLGFTRQRVQQVLSIAADAGLVQYAPRSTRKRKGRSSTRSWS